MNYLNLEEFEASLPDEMPDTSHLPDVLTGTLSVIWKETKAVLDEHVSGLLLLGGTDAVRRYELQMRGELASIERDQHENIVSTKPHMERDEAMQVSHHLNYLKTREPVLKQLDTDIRTSKPQVEAIDKRMEDARAILSDAKEKLAAEQEAQAEAQATLDAAKHSLTECPAEEMAELTAQLPGLQAAVDAFAVRIKRAEDEKQKAVNGLKAQSTAKGRESLSRQMAVDRLVKMAKERQKKAMDEMSKQQAKAA